MQGFKPEDFKLPPRWDGLSPGQRTTKAWQHYLLRDLPTEKDKRDNVIVEYSHSVVQVFPNTGHFGAGLLITVLDGNSNDGPGWVFIGRQDIADLLERLANEGPDKIGSIGNVAFMFVLSK